MSFVNGDHDTVLSFKIRAFVRKTLGFIPLHDIPIRFLASEIQQFVCKNRKDFIPPGFFFEPSESMLIDILFLKNQGSQMPRVVIPTIEIYTIHPRQLLEHGPLGNKAWYVFSSLQKKKENSIRPGRSAGDFGYWNSRHAEDTKGEKGREGRRTNLVFYEGKRPGTKTSWLMQEYRLTEHFQMNEWVICKVYNSKGMVKDRSEGGGSQVGREGGSQIDGEGGSGLHGSPTDGGKVGGSRAGSGQV